MYDARAPIYEDSGKDVSSDFHEAQATDYTERMLLSSGFRVLDMTYSTGEISIPAARAVGLSGTVIGVDICPVSLRLAISKAEKENLSANFFENNIGNAKLLKPGGKLVSDTSTNDSLIPGRCFNIVRQMFAYAGMNGSESFFSRNYVELKELKKSIQRKGEELFESIMQRERWVMRWYEDLRQPGVRHKTKDIFCRELSKLADDKGLVKSYSRFNVAVGEKARVKPYAIWSALLS
ncbi:hypothetical protein BKA65DRAFT_479966 [Rhexocercosporidium sp. MPI-PUGE-AT-0058]|nr:hypothetical protein BKA65DRAFT_479966 [Rhexocercosporidium sp. MPI-PUGE-AT-0058]